MAVIPMLLGLGGALCTPCPVSCLPWCWVLHPSQKGDLEADPAPGAAPVLDGVRVGTLGAADSDPCVNPSRGFPTQTNPFSCKACPGNSVPPTREKPILFQCPAHGTSHQKAFHCFHPIIYCSVPCALEEMVLPNIFHFLSQRSLCKCLLSLPGSVRVILDVTTVAMSSNYVPAWLRWCFNCSPNSALGKHFGSAAFWSQRVQTFRRPRCVTQHLLYGTILNVKAIWEARTNILLKGSSCWEWFEISSPNFQADGSS